jgi:TatA/E family protein of Tat protein translocase
MLNLYAFGLGNPTEWIVIAVVALILLGPKKLPEFARSLGKSVGEMKKGLDETKEQFNSSMHTTELNETDQRVADAERRAAEAEKRAAEAEKRVASGQ